MTVKSKQIKCDVLVVGAGVSGVCAAISAAKNGFSVVLAEKNGFVGGTAVLASLRYICGLYRKTSGPILETVNRGLSLDILKQLKLLRKKPKLMGKVYVLDIEPLEFYRSLNRLLESSNKIKVLLNTEIKKIGRSRSRLIGAIAVNKNEKTEIRFKAIIDSSGEAVVAGLSRAGTVRSLVKALPLSGYTVELKKMKILDGSLSYKVPYYAQKLVKEKKLPDWLGFTVFIPGSDCSRGYLRLNLPGSVFRSKAGNYVKLLYDYFCSCLPEFKKSFIVKRSYKITERQGSAVLGRYILKGQDVVKGKKFFDGVVDSSWPIEFWDRDLGPQYSYVGADGYYQIPARALMSIKYKNLFCSGRCISADALALASCRVMGTSMATGEQAGILAAKYLKNEYF